MEASNSEGWAFGAHPHHRTNSKAPVGHVAGNRRRQQAVQVGKERREAVVRRKRLRRDDGGEAGDIELVTDEDVTAKELEEKTLIAVQELKEAGKETGASAFHKKLEALRNVRRLLSSSEAPPVKVAVEAGVVTLLVDILQFGATELDNLICDCCLCNNIGLKQLIAATYPQFEVEVQLVEAAWCLTNIASGEQDMTRAVLPALPMLIVHLGDRDPAAVEQCAWVIGNIAGEDEEMRNILLGQGALVPLGRLLASAASGVVRTAAWAMSNLIKGPDLKASSDLMAMEGMPEYLLELLAKGDEELVTEVAWVLAYLTSLSDANSEVLINSGLLPPLVEWVATSDKLSVLTPVLRCISNVAAGDNSRTDALLAAGANVPGGLNGGLRRCLDMGQRGLQKEAAWTVSTIAAGTMLHKQIVFQNGTIPSLLHLLATAAFDVRKEAAYALAHVCATPKGTSVDPIVEHLTVLVDRGCIPGFLALVKSPDMEAALVGLQFLDLVMRGLPNGQGPKVVEKEDGIAAMEVLQFHENDELRDMANGLIDKYFGEDYGLEDESDSEIGINAADDASKYPPWRQQRVVNGY